MQSGGQGAGIQLQVGLDLAYFRNQLPSLGTAAAGYSLPIKIHFDRNSITESLRKLGNSLGNKTYKITVQDTNLDLVVKKVDDLADKLKRLSTSINIGLDIGGAAGSTPGTAMKVMAKKLADQFKGDIGAAAKAMEGMRGAAPFGAGTRSIPGFKAAAQGMGLENAFKLFFQELKQVDPQRLAKVLDDGSTMMMRENADIKQGLDAIQSKAKKLASDLGAMGDAAKLTGKAFIEDGGKVLRPQNYGLKIASLLSSVEKLDSDLRKASVETGVDLLSALDDLSKVLRSASNSFVKIAGLSDTLDDTLRGFDTAAKQASRATNAYAERIQRRAGGPPAATAGQPLLPGSRGGALAVQTAVFDPYRVITTQVRESFDIIEDYHKRQLDNFISNYKKIIDQYHRNVLIAAAAQQVRNVRVSELAQRPSQAMLPGTRIAGLLSPEPPGRYRSSRAGETQAELFARREREARMRSAQRETRILSERGGVLPGTTFMGDDFVRGGGRDRVTGSGQPPQRGGALALFSGTTGPSSPLPKDYLEIGRLIKSLDPILQKSKLPLTGAISELSGEFGTAVKQVLLFGTAYKALAFLTGIPAQALQASASLQSFNNQLLAITGTSSEAARSTQFINATVSQFNIPLESARQGFVRLYASMAPAGMGSDTIENLFTGISQASATLGLSADQVDRVTYAFSQMASKGKVMSEEVTGQLGDVLPGALSLMADAAGLSMAEFKKAMEDGLISGAAMEQLFTNLPIVLERRFGKGAAGAAKTLQGQLNNLSTATKTFYESFNPIVNSVAKVVLPLLSSGLKDAQSAIAALGLSVQGINPATNLLSNNAKAIYDNLKILQGTAMSIGSAIQSLGSIFDAFGATLSLTLQLFNAIVGNPIGQFLLKLSIYASLSAAAINLLTKQALIDAIAKFGMMIKSVGLTIASLKALITTSRAAKIAVGGIVAGGILVGLEMLLSHIAKATEQTEKLRKTAILAAEALKQMSYSQMIQEERDIKKRIQNLEKLQNAAQSGSLLVKSPTKAQEEIAVAEGLPITGRAGQRGIDITRAGGVRQQLLQSLRDVQTEMETRDRSAVGTAVITPVDLSDGEKDKDAAKVKDKQKYVSNIAQLLQQEMQQKINKINQDASISDREREVQAAATRYDYELLINKAEYNAGINDENKKDILNRGQYLADLEKTFNAENELSRQRYEDVVTSPLRSMLDEDKKAIIDLEGTLKRLSEGRLESTNVDIRQAQIKKELIGLDEDQIKVLQPLIDLILQTAAARDTLTKAEKRNRAFTGKMTELKNQLTLAQILDPRAERRQQIRQENPDLSDMQVERQAALEEQVEAATKARDQLRGIASSIGDAFGNAFKGIITGSMTAQQALAGMFQSIADSFADMVAKMIAEWLKTQILQGFQSIFSAFTGGLGGSFGGGASIGQAVSMPTSVGIGAGGGILQNSMGQGFGTFGPNFGIRQFANGGIVTGPTLGLVGEGRYNEAVIPLPDGKSVPVDLGGAMGSQITSNIVVNVSSDGKTSSSGAGSDSAGLGRKLEGAVKQVIVDELRPGGLLSGRR